jgi:hypothetical protein
MSDDGENNFAQFEQQAGTEPPVEAAEPPVEEAPAEEALAEGAEPPVEGEQPKPKKDFQSRIDEVTRARREAEREAKYWRDVAEGKLQPQQNGRQQEEGPKEPNPDDYPLGDMDQRYLTDLVDYRVEQGLARGLDKIESRVAQNMHSQAGERVWEAAQEAARSEFDDYDAVVWATDPVTGAMKWPCSEPLAAAIRESDAGAKAAYFLASHPEEARRIFALSPSSQIRELGRIEASLDSPRSRPVSTTNAPKPPQAQARGAGGQFAPNAATQNFAEFEAMANRKT